MPSSLFESFLREKHAYVYIGTDDDMPDAFDDWTAQLDPQELIDFAEEAIVKYSASAIGSIKSDKKAVSSRENGKKGGRPRKDIGDKNRH